MEEKDKSESECKKMDVGNESSAIMPQEDTPENPKPQKVLDESKEMIVGLNSKEPTITTGGEKLTTEAMEEDCKEGDKIKEIAKDTEVQVTITDSSQSQKAVVSERASEYMELEPPAIKDSNEQNKLESGTSDLDKPCELGLGDGVGTVSSKSDAREVNENEANVIVSGDKGVTDVENIVQDASVNPGEKDSEGFLPPPPASTLLIRRSRVGATGATTYVVSSSPGNKTEGGSSPAHFEEHEEASDSNSTFVPVTSGKQSSNSGKPAAMSFQMVKRRPGRPVGSVGKYKKRMAAEPSTEVRMSERARARYDAESSDDSPWIYPTNFRASYLSGGKPPMTGYQSGYSKGKKHGIDNQDPVTGKRKYTRRRKYGFDKRSCYREENEQGDQSAQSHHLSDKGIWRPTDDLRLIINTIATGDLESVYAGVKFSCFFSYKEIEERWRKLMYGEKSSLVAQNAINALHPYVKAKIYFECLFSAEEEKLISSVEVKPQNQPEIKAFQTLLDENPHVFNKYRTPRSLMMHWQDMKDYHLHSYQNPLDFKPSEHFECFEALYNCDIDEEDDLEEPDDNVIEQEIQSEDRCVKKNIRLLEDETAAWQKLVDQMMNDGSKDKLIRTPFCNELDFRTFAVLKGRDVRFAMASREIVIGRATPESKVDANLVEECSARKISRKQAVIRLKDMGRFVIINKGILPIFVDRKVVPFKCAARLQDQSVIQIGPVGLVFVINRTLINHIIEQDMQREIYESFKDLEKDYPPLPSKGCSTPVDGKGNSGKLGVPENSSVTEIKAKTGSKQPDVNPALPSYRGSSRSVPIACASNYFNLDAALVKDKEASINSITALSSTNIPAMSSTLNFVASTSGAGLDVPNSNFTVPVITSVASLSEVKQEPVIPKGHQSVFEAYSAYSMYIPQTSNSDGTQASTSVAAKPKP